MSWWLELPREFTQLYATVMTKTPRAVLLRPDNNRAIWAPNACFKGLGELRGAGYFHILTGFLEREHPHLLPEQEQEPEPATDRLTVDVELNTGLNSIGYTISYRGRIITTHSVEVATQNITGILNALDEVKTKLRQDQHLCYSNNASFQSIKKAFNRRDKPCPKP